jgi:hypothetical protein
MRLRTSKLLKYFAILLFSLEMIAPALISSVDNETDARYDYSHTSLTSTTHLTNFIASLLFEENNGEEEERESKDHKPTLYLNDFGFVKAFIELRTTQTRQISWVEQHQRSASQPALFTLLHSYLI